MEKDLLQGVGARRGSLGSDYHSVGETHPRPGARGQRVDPSERSRRVDSPGKGWRPDVSNGRAQRKSVEGSGDVLSTGYDYHTQEGSRRTLCMGQLLPLFVPIPGGMELMIILGLAVLLFGANKLPKLARSSGQAMGEFKRGRQELEEELQEATTGTVDAASTGSSERKDD
jgi:sec-independent protein translocase protein TatA